MSSRGFISLTDTVLRKLVATVRAVSISTGLAISFADATKVMRKIIMFLFIFLLLFI